MPERFARAFLATRVAAALGQDVEALRVCLCFQAWLTHCRYVAILEYVSEQRTAQVTLRDRHKDLLASNALLQAELKRHIQMQQFIQQEEDHLTRLRRREKEVEERLARREEEVENRLTRREKEVEVRIFPSRIALSLFGASLQGIKTELKKMIQTCCASHLSLFTTFSMPHNNELYAHPTKLTLPHFTSSHHTSSDPNPSHSRKQKVIPK